MLEEVAEEMAGEIDPKEFFKVYNQAFCVKNGGDPTVGKMKEFTTRFTEVSAVWGERGTTRRTDCN
eukprot:6195183-Prymnesium_polylepis.1